MSRRKQAGVIAFRRKKEGVEVCLIRNKDTTKWKIPKGFIDAGETAEEAALKEAREEGGLKGRLVGDTIGSFEYEKWDLELTVAVYLMEVSGQDTEWDESTVRERYWAPLDAAFELLKKHPVQPLLMAARSKLERRMRPR